MIYGSVCSGIEAATVAWHDLGWRPAFFSEIQEFPRAVLSHHYPHVPLHGDFTTIEHDTYEPIDLLVGGTPCQDFSDAGLRAGLDGKRGQLTIEFVELARRLRPRWLVWENVPGVLTIDGGRAFGTLLGALAKCGYGFAYRVLDAQYFGVPQRRRRVLLVGHLRDWRAPAAVLFESESLRGHFSPSRKTQEDASTIAGDGTGSGITQALTRGLAQGGPDLAHAQAGWLVAFSCKDDGGDASHVSPTLRSMNHSKSHTNGGGQIAIAGDEWDVRRITPRECERLQGFPDDYTLVPDPRHKGKLAADTPRYHVLGDTMAVPCMQFIGQQIQMYEMVFGVETQIAA